MKESISLKYEPSSLPQHIRRGYQPRCCRPRTPLAPGAMLSSESSTTGQSQLSGKSLHNLTCCSRAAKVGGVNQGVVDLARPSCLRLEHFSDKRLHNLLSYSLLARQRYGLQTEVLSTSYAPGPGRLAAASCSPPNASHLKRLQLKNGLKLKQAQTRKRPLPRTG